MKTTDSDLYASSEEKDRKTITLGKFLGEIGSKGINFIGRLENSQPIIKGDEAKTQEILVDLNELAKKAPSDPYSALALQGSTLYVVQNKNTVQPEHITSLTQDDALKRLRANNPDIKIYVYNYDPSMGDHPDTVAIAKVLQSGSKDFPIYLGLAAFERGILKNQQPASCGGCAAAINALNDNGYSVSVSSSTLTNFPSNKNYTISEFIRRDPNLMDSYLWHMEESLKKLQQLISPHNKKDLYVQYNIRYEVKEVMSRDYDPNEKVEKIQKLKEQAELDYTEGVNIGKFNQVLSQFSKNIDDARELIPELRSIQEIKRLKNDREDALKKLNNIVGEEKITPEGVKEDIKNISDKIEKLRKELKELQSEKSELEKQDTAANNRLLNIKEYENALQPFQQALDYAKKNLAALDNPTKSQSTGENKRNKNDQEKKQPNKDPEKQRLEDQKNHKLKQQHVLNVKNAVEKLKEAQEKLKKKNPPKDNEKLTLELKLNEINKRYAEIIKNEKQIGPQINNLNITRKTKEYTLNQITTLELLIKDVDDRLPRSERIGIAKPSILEKSNKGELSSQSSKLDKETPSEDNKEFELNPKLSNIGETRKEVEGNQKIKKRPVKVLIKEGEINQGLSEVEKISEEKPSMVEKSYEISLKTNVILTKEEKKIDSQNPNKQTSSEQENSLITAKVKKIKEMSSEEIKKAINPQENTPNSSVQSLNPKPLPTPATNLVKKDTSLRK